MLIFLDGAEKTHCFTFLISQIGLDSESELQIWILTEWTLRAELVTLSSQKGFSLTSRVFSKYEKLGLCLNHFLGA